MGSIDDSHVEAHVGLDPGHGVDMSCLHFFEPGRDEPDVAVVPASGRQLGCHDFNRDPSLVQALDRLGRGQGPEVEVANQDIGQSLAVRPAHVRAAPVDRLGQPPLAQLSQRLPDYRTADAELAGQDPLGRQLRPDLDLAGQDQPLELGSDLLEQPGSVGGRNL